MNRNWLGLLVVALTGETKMSNNGSCQTKINQKVYETLHHLVNMANNFDGYGQGLIHDLEKLLFDSSHTTITGDDE